jgi:hypothetical protein
MNPLIQLKQITSLFLVALLLGCFALSPRARAVVPAPDGGYPGQNTGRAKVPFCISPEALTTRPLVGPH